MSAYPVSLALEDFVPVALTVTGVALLSRLPNLPTGQVRAAAALLAAGGFAKATWKLIVALDGPDIRFLYNALFPLLAAGFLMLVFALLQRPPIWAHGVLLVAVHAACVAVADTWPAMILTIAAVTVAAVTLAATAGDRIASGLFLFWLAGQYVLGPMAAKAEQSISLQWLEQSCNTLTQAALVLAALRAVRAVRPAPQEATA